MSKYVKKPIVIEARQFTDSGSWDPVPWEQLANWCGGKLVVAIGKLPHIIIPTLEGDHRASFGDWIIQGVHGEFYPCKPDIFAETYRPLRNLVDEETASKEQLAYWAAEIAQRPYPTP